MTLKLFLALLLVAVLLGGLALVGYLPRRAQVEAANAAAHAVAVDLPLVTVAHARRAAPSSELLLPGNISATNEASIYARATGYVRKRYVDIGDHVKAGQLLAEIETPDLDSQVAQVRAALAQARQQFTQAQASLVQFQSQRDLAKLTWQRYDTLVKRGAVARQDADQQESGYKTSEALVNAQEASVRAATENVAQAQANLDRMTSLQDYKNVRSPIAGVVTVRNVDAGYLISAAGAAQGNAPTTLPGAPAATATGNEMFRVAQIETLRIMLSVPQPDAPSIVQGMPAEALLSEFPGRTFPGKVTRTASSLDPNSRTMLTQVEIPNREGKLFPGMYVQIRLTTRRAVPPVIVPGDSIIAGGTGTQVAIVQDVPGNPTAKKIHLQPVRLGRDYGPQTEIATGLEGNETVIVNPGDIVREGNLVKLLYRDAAPARGGR